MDVFENEKFIFIASTFVLGTILPTIIYPIHAFIYLPLQISNSTDPLFSFLFFTLGVGLLEECVKILPVLIILRIFKPAINEPLDYIKYACVSALGFAFGENIGYAMRYDESVLLVRSILSVPAHMFFSTLFVYGYIVYKYNNQKPVFIVYYGVLGFVAHGLYDYLLGIENKFIGVALTITLFLLIISVFVNIVNNGLNNSPFYSPKKSVDQLKVRSVLTKFYSITVFVIFCYSGFIGESGHILALIIMFIIRDFSILAILIVRLSRVSIIPALWRDIKLEFPVSRAGSVDRNDTVVFGLTIKGKSYNDYHISLLYEEEVFVVPMSSRKSYLSKTYRGVIEKKLYQNEQAVFILKLFLNEQKTDVKYYIVVTKKTGITHSEGKYPIVSINSVKAEEKDKMIFHEWVILKKAV